MIPHYLLYPHKLLFLEPEAVVISFFCPEVRYGDYMQSFVVVCSTWVMMNRKTRKLSKMPEEVRAEICPYFLERSAIKDESLLTQKIIRLNGNAEFVRSGLTVSCPSLPLRLLTSCG